MREKASNRTSIAGRPDGLIRLRTPEGQEIYITLERACEWLNCPNFEERLGVAIGNCPVPFKLAKATN